MSKKLQPIDYTSRDFDSIRRDLENYAKRYYPDTYKDFNKASFGSLMLDTVAYIGDILSFYLDYQTNESFLETSIEYNNVVRLARQMGFKLNTSPSSFGILSFYIQVPSTSDTGVPDVAYAPVLRAGSIFSSTGGGLYTLLEDVDFSLSTNQVVVGTVDSTSGSPTNYVIRAQGRAVSGRTLFKEIELGDFQRFLRVDIENSRVAEVLSVTDSEGHEYVEVDHLSQNVIYKAIRNTNSATNSTVRNILKAAPVARRFTVEREGNRTYLQFGYGSDSELLSNSVVDPSNLVLDLNGRTYVTDLDFDPTKLISTDKFGIAPANTTLRIGYRVNLNNDVNAAVNTITGVDRPLFKFAAQGSISQALRSNVVSSLEVLNEEPFVGDVSLPSSDEIKQRVFGFYATQNRAVTIQDYQSICYGMPGKFGSVKRAAVIRDFDEFKRNLNLYVISEDTSGKLIPANATLKNNLRNWILQYKVVNDTVDILDAQIANFGINYVVVVDLGDSRFSVISRANAAIRDYILKNQYDIGESILITDFYKVLQKVKGVIDVVDLEIISRAGGTYSSIAYDFQNKLSADGRRIEGENNVVFELKFPNIDITGAIQ
tara:strand:- start:20073 stop:21872 length:1800 start_codon:yes stop_codon:yes gene_type:complete